MPASGASKRVKLKRRDTDPVIPKGVTLDHSKFQDDTILSEWILSEAEQGEHTDLSMKIGDWSRANEIRAEIFLPDNVDDQIYCTHPDGHTDRIKMDWCDTQGPVLI